MKVAIACFVKTLGLSPVKTRLAAGLGRAAADDVYGECVELMRISMQTAVKEPNGNVAIHPHWALAEVEALTLPVWSDFPKVLQIDPDRALDSAADVGLGERMKRVYEELSMRFDGVILIGADCPLLSPARLISAATTVANSDSHLLGPTDDGGFYLFGSRFSVDETDRPSSRSVWLNTSYSASDTAAQFTTALEERRHVETLETLFDLDVAQDIERLCAKTSFDEIRWNQRVVSAFKRFARS